MTVGQYSKMSELLTVFPKLCKETGGRRERSSGVPPYKRFAHSYFDVLTFSAQFLFRDETDCFHDQCARLLVDERLLFTSVGLRLSLVPGLPIASGSQIHV